MDEPLEQEGSPSEQGKLLVVEEGGGLELSEPAVRVGRGAAGERAGRAGTTPRRPITRGQVRRAARRGAVAMGSQRRRAWPLAPS